jgi:LPPG:FO 2-phospho-L-lactate transferase
MMWTGTGRVVALSGGVGGAKLALGLMHCVPPDRLTLIVNTADDFEHLGLHVSPDIDTMLYTLSGLANTEAGWGLAGETWNFMHRLRQLGGPGWFNLGDGDLATHIQRTGMLRAGKSLTEATAALSAAMGVGPRVLPMTDQPVRTMVATQDGTLGFQSYFVEHQCAPVVTGITFEGARAAQITAEAAAALADPDLVAIILCPSNPWLSVDPILAVPGYVDLLRNAPAPVVAVSPIVGGKAVKGPTAKIMAELGLTPDASAVANHYGDLLDGYLVDLVDADLIPEIGVPARSVQSVMKTLEDRVDLAKAALEFAAALSRR